MKKFLLLFCSISLCTFFASAQITKGSVLLGGGLSFNQTKYESGGMNEFKATGFSISPNIGFAVKDNQVFGIFLSYGHSKNRTLQASNYDSDMYGGGLFVRRYLSLSKNFYLFGEANAGYNRNTIFTQYFDHKETQKHTNIGVGLYPGITYAVNKKFHLEAGMNSLISLGFSGNKIIKTFDSGIEAKTESSGFGFSSNLSTSAPLTIGFRIVLGK